MTIKFIDLFAGVGGFHYAFQNKANCVFSSEWDKYARVTYLLNWGEDLKKNNAEFAEDITKVDYETIPDFDILCGGFPCQPFSIAGKQLGFNHETQGNLFFNIIKIIQIKKPKVVFLENVKNLVGHDNGNTFKVIIESLEAEGYLIKHKVLNGLTHGNTPQNRERIFIVGFKNKKEYDKFEFPEEIKLNKKISDCLEKDKLEEKLYQTNLSSKAVIEMQSKVINKNTIYQYRRYYIRENKSGFCPTLTANMGTGGHNVPLIRDDYGVRKLSPRECFNLQGYPIDFKLPNISISHLYKQAGNSIVVTVVERIAHNIINALKN